MKTNHSWETKTANAAATEELAEAIGKQLKGGEVIELVSDLGGGKTTFVRGLAKGFGSTDRVASPTFTISKVYKDKHRELHHFDFYRLQEAGLIAHELAEVVNDPACTVVVEWGDVVSDVLPTERLKVAIARTGEEARTFSFSFSKTLSYLLEGIDK